MFGPCRPDLFIRPEGRTFAAECEVGHVLARHILIEVNFHDCRILASAEAMSFVGASQRLKGDIYIQPYGSLAVLDMEIIFVIGGTKVQSFCLKFTQLGAVRKGFCAAGQGKMCVKIAFNTRLRSSKADKGALFCHREQEP